MKKTLFIALCLILLGGSLVVAVFGSQNWNINKVFNYNLENKTYNIEEAFTSVKINTTFFLFLLKTVGCLLTVNLIQIIYAP